MSVDFEFRNKKKMWSYAGTPSYSTLKKFFESGKIPGVKVVPLEKEYRMLPTPAFSLDCGGGCWLYIYDGPKHYPMIKMSHFDHVERANTVLQKAAAFFDCVVLNDLEHGESEVWNGKPSSKKTIKKPLAPFGITLKPINIKNIGLYKKRRV